MASLRELSSELQELYELAEECGEDDEALNDTLEGLMGELGIKMDGYMSVISQMESDIEMLKKEEKRISDKRKVLENNVERMKNRIKLFVETQPDKKFSSSFYKFSIRKNAPALTMEDGADIPIKFLIPQEPKFDKEAMKKELKAGVEYKGFSLTQSESLIIK